MQRIVGTRCSGKTTTMVKNAIENSCHSTIIFVTGCPDYIKGMVHGLETSKCVRVLTYKEFLAQQSEIGNYEDIYIDEIDGLLAALGKQQIKGYTLSVERFLTEVK